MPAGVVVVKRARRRAFAILWAVPAWLHSIASSLRRRRGEARALLAEEPIDAVQFPALRFAKQDDGDALSRCNACGDCVTICPSHSLVVVAAQGRPSRFELDPGACIGCARCIEICPEDALAATPAAEVLTTSTTGRVMPIDLLAPAERML